MSSECAYLEPARDDGHLEAPGTHDDLRRGVGAAACAGKVHHEAAGGDDKRGSAAGAREVLRSTLDTAGVLVLAPDIRVSAVFVEPESC